MPAEYKILAKRNGKFDVYWRELFPQGELAARLHHMVQMGMTAEEAQCELNAMTATRRCNTDNEGYELPFCDHFVASYIQPWDCINYLGRIFIVGKQGEV